MPVVKTPYNSSMPDGSPAWMRSTMLAHGCAVPEGASDCGKEFTARVDEFIVLTVSKAKRNESCAYFRKRRRILLPGSGTVPRTTERNVNTGLADRRGCRGRVLAAARFRAKTPPYKPSGILL